MPPKGTGHVNEAKKKSTRQKAQECGSVVWLMEKSSFSHKELQNLTQQFKKIAMDNKSTGKKKKKKKGKAAAAAEAGSSADGGGDALISKEEFVTYFSDIMKVNTTAAEELFLAADDSGDGYVDYLEFITMMSTLYKGGIEGKLEIIFDAYDTDDNRFISKKEMRSLLQHSITMEDEALKEAEIERIIAQAFAEMDANGDGYISFPEAKAALKKNPRILAEYFGQNIVDCDDLL